MISADIILDIRYKSKSGFPVKIRIYDGKIYKYINLKIYQDKKKLERSSEIKKRESLLEQQLEHINKFKLDVDQAVEVINDGIPDKDLELILLRKRISELEKRSSIGFIEFLDLRIKEKKQSGESVRNYEIVKNAVKSFLFPKEDVPINEINYEWLNRFILEKRGGGARNGINSYLRGMRAVYKEAQRRESLGIKSDNPFLGLISVSPKKETLNIGADQLKLLLNYKPPLSTTERNEKIIRRNLDLFLFQFAIGGHDFADIANLKWKDIKDGRVRFRRFKNRNKPGGGEPVDNMLNDFALGVIEKYGKRGGRVFGFIPDPKDEEVYGNFRNVVYRSLGRVSDHLKIERISTKSPRYLFRSLGGELLIDSYALMQIQGHTPQGVTFGYQRKLPNEIIDREHQKILDLVW